MRQLEVWVSLFEDGRRLPFEVGSDRSDLSKLATEFDLANVRGKSRCVAIGSLGFDLVDHIKRGMVKADSLLSAFGTLTYFDYRQNQIGESNLH
jgi:hypothetical protein